MSTGFIDIDRTLGGLRPSDLIILAGRPAMGKSALATAIGVNVARAGKPVAFFSLEMSGDQLAARIISSQAGVSGFLTSQGKSSADDMRRLCEAKIDLDGLPLQIDETGARTVPAMVSQARRMARKDGLSLVIVDYIGLAAPADPKRGRQKVHEIEEITNGLKALAKTLKVPVIALCQLSRQVEQRDDKRPMLSDLRDSGAIEQDADAVLFLYREEYYLANAEPKNPAKAAEWQQRLSEVKNTAELIIAKHRHGPTGTVPLYFDGSLTKFGDLHRGDCER